MSARWSVLLGAVAALSASSAAVVSATFGRMSTNPVGELAARKGNPPRYRYLFSLDPGNKMTVMTMDSNSGHASLDQIPLWVGAADYVGLDPYPCYHGAPCKYAWINAIIEAADRAGLSYWGVVQAFQDSTWRWPTAREERHMLCQWANSRESGYVVFAWTWAGQSLSNRPRLLRVLTRFNQGSAAKFRRHPH